MIFKKLKYFISHLIISTYSVLSVLCCIIIVVRPILLFVLCCIKLFVVYYCVYSTCNGMILLIFLDSSIAVHSREREGAEHYTHSPAGGSSAARRSSLIYCLTKKGQLNFF